MKLLKLIFPLALLSGLIFIQSCKCQECTIVDEQGTTFTFDACDKQLRAVKRKNPDAICINK